MSPFADHDKPDLEDLGEENDLPEMSCPNCRGSVVEDTQKCPHCGDWITPVDSSAGGWRRWWLAVAVLLMLLAMLLFVLR